MLGIPFDVAREMPPRLQEMLGYSIHPPFIGQLSASHPRKALARMHVVPVVEQARAAGAKLPGDQRPAASPRRPTYAGERCSHAASRPQRDRSTDRGAPR